MALLPIETSLPILVFFQRSLFPFAGPPLENKSLIGAGSVVTKNITEPGVYVGNPARKIKEIND